jgi:hypothetical protein
MWAVRQAVFAHSDPAEFGFLENPLLGADFPTARMTAIKVIGKYLRLLAWPQRLSCSYSYNQVPSVDWRLSRWEDWQALVALAAVLGLFVVAAACYRRYPAGFFFLCFAALTLLPTANILVLIGSVMAERFLYLPAAGFAGCIVVAVYAAGQRFCWRAWVAPAILSAIAAAYGVRTCLRNPDWHDEETLWMSAVKVNPGSFMTHFGLANSWLEKSLCSRTSTGLLPRTSRQRRLSTMCPTAGITPLSSVISAGATLRKVTPRPITAPMAP